MALFQAGVLHLGLCIIIMLLICADFTKSNKLKILWINKTADQGDTVVLHCNGSENTGVDFVWRKEKNLLFNYSPIINQTVTNYTSSRMSVDPSDPLKLQISNVQPSDAGTYCCFPSKMYWTLTIIESEQEIQALLLYTVSSTAGAIVVICIILCTVWIHRKWKTRTRKNEVELQQLQGRRIDNVHNRQYFERFNSIYGQIVS